MPASPPKKPNRARRRRTYTQRHDGERLEVEGRTHMIRCCDCGLVHTLKFQVEKGSQLSFKAWRDDRATAASRRGERFAKTLGADNRKARGRVGT